MELRRVDDSDVFRLYRWYRDPETTRFFVSPKPDLTWNEHVEWFIAELKNPNWHIGLWNGVPIGSVRAGKGVWVFAMSVSIVIAPEHRGVGHGARLLQRVSDVYPPPTSAVIHRLNAPSIRIFEKCGYQFKRSEGVWNTYRKGRLDEDSAD